MGKHVRVNVEGFGTVLVDKPKKYNKESFADGVGEAVAGTLGLILDRDRTSFHPVLGRGGYDWNHEAQAADVSEARTPRAYVQEEAVLRFRMLQVWNNILYFARGIREQFYSKGDR